MEEFTAVAITTYDMRTPLQISRSLNWSSTTRWHQPAIGAILLDEENKTLIWDGEVYTDVYKCVGLEGQCVALTARRYGQDYKLYTNTPTSNGSTEGILRSLRQKGLR
jgi:hypothetical protein